MTGYLYRAIETIRLGIVENDMSKVSEGFELLTGQKVSGESLEEPEEVVRAESRDGYEEKFNDGFIAGIKKTPQTESSVANRKKENKFQDDGSHTIEEAGYDAVHDGVEPVARQRPSFKMVEQRCHVCGKTEEVHPVHKRDFFKCTKCIAR